jgi:hypothetical protein
MFDMTIRAKKYLEHLKTSLNQDGGNDENRCTKHIPEHGEHQAVGLLVLGKSLTETRNKKVVRSPASIQLEGALTCRTML